MNITKLPLEELEKDKYDSIVDIGLCQFALLHGHTHYSDGCSIMERKKTNEEIITIINTELNRRETENKNQ